MGVQQMFLGSGAGSGAGQVDFDDHTSLDYTTTWTVPDGVEKISVLCIGRGGKGSGYNGGAGGNLAYMNNITVVAGDVYTIYICGGYNATDDCTLSPYTSDERWLVGSQIRWLSGSGHPWRVAAYCAENQYNGATGGYEWSHNSLVHGSFIEHVGGNGGSGSSSSGWGSTNYYFGGGGGAAGYTHDGGNGDTYGDNYSAGAGSGGGGGGGYTGWYQTPSGDYDGTAWHGGGGGGVGKYGGDGFSNGAAGTASGYSGTGGSGGTPTSSVANGNPGEYGGGSSANFNQGVGTFPSTVGGKGLVRIIWPGDERYYPNTGTTNQ